MADGKQSKYKPCPDCGSTHLVVCDFVFGHRGYIECEACEFNAPPDLWNRIMPKGDK